MHIELSERNNSYGGKLNNNVGSVAVKSKGITISDLTRVIYITRRLFEDPETSHAKATQSSKLKGDIICNVMFDSKEGRKRNQNKGAFTNEGKTNNSKQATLGLKTMWGNKIDLRRILTVAKLPAKSQLSQVTHKQNYMNTT